MWETSDADPISDLRAWHDHVLASAGVPHPCDLGRHIISPRALYRPGTYVCGNCNALVEVPVPLSELR